MCAGGAQVMFVLFAVVASLWGAVLTKQRAHAHRLHGLMAVLVAFKALTLLSQAGMFQLIRTTGHPEGWNVAFYVFNFLRGILFFTVRFFHALLLAPFLFPLKQKAGHAGCGILFFTVGPPHAAACSTSLSRSRGILGALCSAGGFDCCILQHFRHE